MATDFPHLSLKLVQNAPPPQPKGFGGKDPRTIKNKENRAEHATKLINSVEKIKHTWKDTMENRKDNLSVKPPDMPSAIPLHFKVDTNALPVEELRKFDIEVIGELEDGFVIGASDDTLLNTLSKKIEKFSSEKQNNVAALWEITEGLNWKMDILSPQLLEKYNTFNDKDFLVLDVGIACLSTIYIPDHPSKRKKQYQGDEERYQAAIDRWKKKRDLAYRDWNSIAKKRSEDFTKIINQYGGEILSMERGEFSSFSFLPDSINCRIKISFICMKDLLLNYPFLFEISEVESIAHSHNVEEALEELDITEVEVVKPSDDSPYVCVIDSGIAEKHVLLKNAIKSSDSKSWIGSTTDVADYVEGGGHGTKVAGGILYHENIPSRSIRLELPFWLQNARVLDENNEMPVKLIPSSLLKEIVDLYYNGPTRTRIYNHSINSLSPYGSIHMSPWATAIDQLSWENDVVFIVSSGNIPIENSSSSIRLGILDHYNLGREYPDYLLESSSRISNPAQSLQAITVGSIGLYELTGINKSFSKKSEPSSFSCTGPGIWGSVKPEVVEYGGDFAYDGSVPPNLSVQPQLTPLLIRSTMYGGFPIGRDEIGTSFSTSKVTHILASIQKAFPLETTLFYRTLLIQSARWPDWAEGHSNKENVIRSLGYGIPNKIRATENDPYRVTLITRGDREIKGRQVHVYEVKIPEELYKPSSEHKIRIDITLSYKAQPRRTRRNRKRYLSKWLEWQTSKENEPTNEFLKRVIDIAEQDEDYPSEEEGSELFNWMIRERDSWGQIKGINRNAGTVQKDWAIIESNKLREGFCIAVIGHHGWNSEPDVEVPYCLSVSFESINKDVKLYELISVENTVEVDVIV